MYFLREKISEKLYLKLSDQHQTYLMFGNERGRRTYAKERWPDIFALIKGI